MIPNLDQLLLVCGVAIGVVALIVWLLVKLPIENASEDDD
ncbi:MAG: hypothetical protein ACJA0G_002558 [Kangiellaceae bacterium]|jgi:hypothetical protein